MNLLRVKTLLIIATLALGLAGGQAAAITNEEFMEICAGERGPSGAAAIKSALDAGAEVNFSGPGGITPLMVFVSSHQDGDWQAVSGLRILLKAGAELNAKSADGGTALSYAVLNRAGPRIISTLLQHGADVNQGVEAGGGVTPLMIAASLDPDPVVSALLLAAGAKTEVTAEKDGRRSTLLEMAQQNPNPRVRRFIEATAKRKNVSESPPLFADLPEDQGLRDKIARLDKSVRELIGPDNWLGWLGYIKWQIDLAGNVELRRSAFGNSLEQAWLNEYQYYLEALEESGERGAFAPPGRNAARLLIQGSWPGRPGGRLDIISAFDRRLVIMRRSDHGGLVAYETESGRELWRYTPSALSGFYLIGGTKKNPEGAKAAPEQEAPAPVKAEPAPKPPKKKGTANNSTAPKNDRETPAAPARPEGAPLLLVTSHWGDQFGDAALLDPLSGEVLLDLPPLDSPKWTVDAQNRVLAISTDYSLDIFDLRSLQNSRRNWYSYLESRPWDEAKREARTEQNELLAPFGLSLDNEGRFSQDNNDLFRPPSQPDPERLNQALEALKQHNYEPLELMALDRRNLRGHNFVLGPECRGDCQQRDLDMPLFLVSQAQNRIDTLMLDNSPERILTRGALGWAEDQDGRLRPLITFSPGGVTLAIAEAGGDIHFFSIPEHGRYLGTLPGQTVLDSAGGLPVKDSRLLAILDDEASGRPFCAFARPGREAPGIFAAQIDLAAQKIASIFRPRPGAAKNLSAFAVSPADHWAVGLEGGVLWKVEPDGREPEKLMEDPSLEWTALAFSGDGRKLLAAERDGALHLFEAGQAPRILALDMKKIRHLALDQEGRFAWAAAEEYGRGRQPALALVDLSGRNKPVYRAGAGPVLSLVYKPEAGYAVAVEDQPPPAQATPKELKSLDVVRWRQGRADILKFDHLRRLASEGGRGIYDSEISFVGLAPDLGSFFFQELSPSRAFINLGRESVNARQTENLESFTYQSRLGAATFSPDSRLALLPERGGEEDERWPYQAAGAFYLYDQDSGREMAYMSDRGLHPGGLRGVSFLSDGVRLLSFGRNGTVRLWSLKGSRPVNTLSWIFLKNGNWAIVDKDGRFDSPAPDYLDGLHWVVAGSGRPALPLSSTLADFYQPRLTAYLQAGAALPDLKPLAARSLLLPKVKVLEIKAEADAPGRVAVTVELESLDGKQTRPVRDLKLYRDGRLLARLGSRDKPLKLEEGQITHSFRHLALPRNGQAVFSAQASNIDGLAAPPARAAIKYRPAESDERPVLHLMGLGVNDFSKPDWNLYYAADDAQAYARLLPRHFLGSRAEAITLTSGSGRARPSAANLRASLQSLAPHQTADNKFTGAGPDDVVFIDLSSRGFSQGSKYRLLASDLPAEGRTEEGREFHPEAPGASFGAEELADWLANVDAGEIILVIDGYPPELNGGDKPSFSLGPDKAAFEPGPMGDRGLALLAYEKKMRFLSSVGRKDLAAAYGERGLGLAAYALLADGLENKQVAAEGAFTFSQWLEFGRRRIGELQSSLEAGKNGGPLPPPRFFDFGGPGRPLLTASPPD